MTLPVYCLLAFMAVFLLSSCSSSNRQSRALQEAPPVKMVEYRAGYEDSGKYSLPQVSVKTGLSVAELERVKDYWHLTNDDLYAMKDKALRKSLSKIDKPKATFPGEAVKFRMESLVDENGVIPEKAYQRALSQMGEMPLSDGRAVWGNLKFESGDPFLSGATSGIDPVSWTWLGPGNIGGRLRSCVIDPVNKDTMWVGSIAGGIWKTTNGGAVWAQEDDFMTNLAVSTMVMDPTDANTIYAGTGEGFYNADALRGAGVFKTTDGGAHWNQLASTTGSSWYYVNRLAINGDASVLLAATNSGIYRSLDAGVTWTQELTGRVLDVKFDPNNNDNAVAGGASHNCWHSTDGGDSWTAATGLGTSGGRIELAYSASEPGKVWACVDVNEGLLYDSTDGGQTYSSFGITGHLGSQGWYDNVIWVDPMDGDKVYIGGIDLYRVKVSAFSMARISYWQSSPASAHADHHFIVPHPDFGLGGGDSDTVFFCNDGGIYKGDMSQVNGDSSGTGWTELNNNLGTTQLYGAAGNSTSGVIIGGCQDNGTIRFSGNTETWTEVQSGDGGYCLFDQNDSDYCYGEYVYGQIFRNSAGGVAPSGNDWIYQYISGKYYNSGWKWKPAPYKIDDAESSSGEFIAPICMDPNLTAQNRVYVGMRSLWRTNDAKTANVPVDYANRSATPVSGPTWAVVKAAAGSDYNYNITAVTVAPGNSDVVWVGHRNGNVYMTTNGTAAGPTWSRMDDTGTGLPNRRVQRITIDADDNNTVYVCFGGFSSDNVYCSTNAGAAWTDITGSGATGLPDVPVRGFAIHPDNSSWLYAGTEIGIFASSDGGANWSVSNEGPTNCSVDELFWMEAAGTPVLVAATHGRGVFKITIPAVSAGLGTDDFNGDGTSDVLWHNVSDGTTALYFMNSTGVDHTSEPGTETDTDWQVFAPGDFDGDDISDILWINEVTNELKIWFIDTNGDFDYELDVGSIDLANYDLYDPADFNGDGKADLLWRHKTNGKMYLWYMDASGHNGSLYLGTVNDYNYDIYGPADVNGDGIADIIWRNHTTGVIYLWYMNAAGTDHSNYVGTVPDNNWVIETFGDYDGDGSSEIMWRDHNSGEGTLIAWHLDNVGHASGQYIGTIGDMTWQIAGSGDFNGDGYADLLWRNSGSGDVVSLKMNNLGSIGATYLGTVADTNWEIKNK